MTQQTKWLPSIAIRILIGLLAIVVIFIGIYGTVKEKNQLLPEKNSSMQIISNTKYFDQSDTDNDGLKNWEEALWTTNPEDADTDKDGTSDGAEVDAGRNPLVAGPDDILYLVTVREATTTNSTTSPTQTELFSKAFITSYLTSKLSGGSFSDQLDTLSALAIPELPLPTLYTTSDIKITNDTSENIIHAYGNTLGEILERNAPNTVNEMILVLQALQNDDETYLNDLFVIATAYKADATDMTTVTVPEDIVVQHLNTINSFLLVARDLELAALLFEDSLTAIAGLESYFVSSDKLLTALDSLSTYLSENTFFEQFESGYVFTSEL